MSFPVKVKLSIDRPPDVTIREWRQITKQATGEMGRLWHKKFAPLHFTTQGAKRYGYRPRSNAYINNKRLLAGRGKVESGGVVPLVFSGLARQSLLFHATIRAFPTRATVIMPAPSYVGTRSRGNRPDLGAEATTIIEEEAIFLSDFLSNRVAELLNAVRESRTINVG